MKEKKIVGIKATEYIQDDRTGSTAYCMIEKVGELVRQGLHIKAVATSQSTTIHIPFITGGRKP